MNALWLILGIIGAAVLALILNHDSGTLFGMSSNNFGRFVYLSVWALAIGVAVISRRTSWHHAARNAVLWLAIVLALVSVYSYRYDLQDFGARLTGGLIPGSPISDSSANGRSRTTLIRDRDGHFHARGTVNGTQVDFLVDTGASTVVLTGNDAARAGIDTSRLSYSTPVATANGRATAAKVILDTLDIGDIHRRDVTAMVTQPGALSTSLLGMNYLSSLWSFEFRGDRLILTD